MMAITLLLPFSFLYAEQQLPIINGDETGGAETEAQTGGDGNGPVKKDSEEDADVSE